MVAFRITTSLVSELTLISAALAFGFSFDPEMESDKLSELSEEVCSSNRKFSIALHKTLTSDTEENVIHSPFSLHTILSLLSYGAKNSTANDLKAGLFHPDSNLETGVKSLTVTLNKVNDVEFNVVNTIYVQENLPLERDFVATSAEIFGAGVTQVDFKKASSAIVKINSWVVEKTRNKIKELITEDDISEDTRVILVNAVYFKGSWKNKFDPELTQKLPFYNINNKEKQVSMMYKSATFSHGALTDFSGRFVEIPYKNEDFSCVIILPNDTDGLKSLEENFNWDTVLKANVQRSKVDLYLPKFKLEVKINLKGTLEKLGMRKIFQDDADFSGMSNVPLKVSQVVQKVFIEVDEEGSEAAAASGVQMRLRRSLDDGPEEFRVERPFLFTIYYKPINLPIFVGSVRDIGVFPVKDEL